MKTKRDEKVKNEHDKKNEEQCTCEECECKDEKQCNCKKEIEELKNQNKRILADYQNLEKRVREQRQEWVKSASKDVIIRLLPVLDTLMLAHKHVEDEGLKLSIQQFLQALKQEGVEKIKTAGEHFDPQTMEGIGKTEGEEGKVVEEVRAGYVLYDKVIRPAQVIVGEGLKN